MTKVPAWLKRPAGASFGFGGKLVSCINERQRDKFVSAHLDVTQVSLRFLNSTITTSSFKYLTPCCTVRERARF